MFQSIKSLVVLTILCLFANIGFAKSSTYKCMIQMKGYQGEEAYVVVSLVSKDGKYQKTLSVLGADKKWYPDLPEWHKAHSAKPTNISTITGASIAGGDRRIVNLEIDDELLNKGYMIRFESAVEDQGYHVKDLEVPFTKEGLENKSEGKGFIRSVRFTN